MKNIISAACLLLLAMSALFTSCKKDDDTNPFIGLTYQQEDQMGRPAINTVFVMTADKDDFNTTLPSQMESEYAGKFQAQLHILNPNYTTNALGWDATTFAHAVATDVLTLARTGTTTFYDGTNVLTGRNLADDVISTELLLIFGGPNGTDKPGLTDDHVDENDKPFLASFPYLADPH